MPLNLGALSKLGIVAIIGRDFAAELCVASVSFYLASIAARHGERSEGA